MEGIENILKAGMTVQASHPQTALIAQITSVIEECGGLQKIEDLQNHENNAIYERSVKILETYFGAEDDVEDVYVAPSQPQQMDGGGNMLYNQQQVPQQQQGFPAQYAFGAQPTNQQFSFGNTTNTNNPPQPPFGGFNFQN